MDQIIYGVDGTFQCILRTNADGSTTSFGPGSNLWSAYVVQNGIPPSTGAPTFPPPPLPAAVQNAITVLKAFSNNASPVLSDVIAAQKAQIVIDKYLFQQLLS